MRGISQDQAVRRRPYAVILFDEVEKAHPDVFNVVLQILDLAGDPARHGEMEKRVNDALRAHFRPEFLNRLDETIIFHSLRSEELRRIVELQVKRLAKRLEDRKLGLQLDGEALDWLAGVGYDPVYGARPLKRAIQRELETPIAKAILAGTFSPGAVIAVDVENERLRFSQAQEAQLSVLV